MNEQNRGTTAVQSSVVGQEVRYVNCAACGKPREWKHGRGQKPKWCAECAKKQRAVGQRKYEATDAGKAATERYRKSPKGKLARKKANHVERNPSYIDFLSRDERMDESAVLRDELRESGLL